MTDNATVKRDRLLVEEASKGPWEAMVLGSEGYIVTAPPPNDGTRFNNIRRPMVARCGNEAWEVDKANAAFIARFDPPTITKMLDVIETAEVVRYELLHVIDNYPETQDLIHALDRFLRPGDTRRLA